LQNRWEYNPNWILTTVSWIYPSLNFIIFIIAVPRHLYSLNISNYLRFLSRVVPFVFVRDCTKTRSHQACIKKYEVSSLDSRNDTRAGEDVDWRLQEHHLLMGVWVYKLVSLA
jgi:hypothetical protein